MYAALRGEALLENNHAFTNADVLPALEAAATLLVLNMALVSAAVAFRSGESVREHLRANLHFLISGSVLATLAPVVAAVMTSTSGWSRCCCCRSSPCSAPPDCSSSASAGRCTTR